MPNETNTYDYLNNIEKAVKEYLVANLGVDFYVIEVGFPDLYDKAPLDKTHIAVSIEDDTTSSIGFGNILEVKRNASVEAVEGIGVEIILNIDIFTSRGTKDVKSGSGGRTGALRTYSKLQRLFTINSHLFHQQYPGVEILRYDSKFLNTPEFTDNVDLFNLNSELVLSLTIESA